MQEELKQYVNKETCTADNIKVCLAANIGNADDATKAMTAGAEGVGLFRTEFLFMNGVKMPTEEKQDETTKKAIPNFIANMSKRDINNLGGLEQLLNCSIVNPPFLKSSILYA